MSRPGQHRWNIGVVRAAPMEHWCRCDRGLRPARAGLWRSAGRMGPAGRASPGKARGGQPLAAATPAAITAPTTPATPVALLDWNRPNPRQAMNTAAPLYSHLSWRRRSPLDLRYLGTWTASHTTQDTSRAKNPMFTTTTHSSMEPLGWSMVNGVPLASTRTTGAAAAMAKGTNITAPNSRPRANRAPPTGRQRPRGRCPSGNSHRQPAVRTSPPAQAAWRAMASRPRGRVP
jgi:hypothetical protein